MDENSAAISESRCVKVKDMKLLIWITQLGISVAAPLGGFIILAVWLRDRFSWGNWVVIVGAVLGILCAAEGLLSSIRAMRRMQGTKETEDPGVSFNEHE